MADDNEILALTTEIVASYAGNAANLRAEELPALIRSVRAALMEADAPTAPSEPEVAKPTKGQINRSVQPHAITSFLDGKPYKSLKRHLTRLGHTPASYKAAYGLPSDYPMTSPDYSAARSEMAKKIGLGAKGRGEAAANKPVAKAPAKRGPKAKIAAPVGES